jgi:hypothetical protein
MSGPRRTTAKESRPQETILPTVGEVFADGAVIELVAVKPGNANDLGLLLWDGRKARIAPQIKHLGQLYCPMQIDETIRRAVPMPRSAGGFRSLSRLLGETAGLFENYIGLPSAESTLVAGWSAMTWLVDRMLSPPPLVIAGPDMDLAVRLFRLLRCVCRRSLLLADVSRSTIRGLPMCLWPTLLVNQPDLSPKVRASWRASNYDGVFVPGNRGTVSHIACAKALYVALEPSSDDWCDSALHIVVPRPPRELPLLGPAELAEIADRFQPKFLMFRLKNLVGSMESRPVPSHLNLPACIEEESDFVAAVGPLVERQKRDSLARRTCDFNAAVVEILWEPSHRTPDISVDNITQLVNALLRCRGEVRVYSNEETGWCLRSFGLYRDRAAGGMMLRFSREHRWQIHQVARQCGLTLPLVDGCPDCSPKNGPADGF